MANERRSTERRGEVLLQIQFTEKDLKLQENFDDFETRTVERLIERLRQLRVKYSDAPDSLAWKRVVKR